MQRRNSTASLDSLALEKEEAHNTSAPRSGLRSTLSKLARQLSGAREEKGSTTGPTSVAAGSAHEHERFQVYVVGSQVVYLGPGSNRRTRKGGEETKKAETMDAEKERKTSTEHWDDAGAAQDARVVRRTG